ncbi:MAG TPA: flagellar type III secretion system protein FlhB [Acetobacteraceae bacterium]|nr:flagellar type III secretion system protein FlhB [Acetobacteraceae bacterium]
MAEDQEGKTEAATPKRLLRAREEGSVALSRDLSSFAGLAGAVGVLAMAAPGIATALSGELAGLLAHIGTIRLDADGPAALGLAARAAAGAAAPVIFVVLLAGTAATLAQTGLLFRPGAFAPDPGRIDPRRWFQRMASPEGLFEQGKAFVKLALLGFISWHVLAGGAAAIEGAAFLSPAGLFAAVRAMLLGLVLPMLAGLALITVADVLWVRLRHARSLRMTREEVRQEVKENEGDPQLKAKLKQIRKARSKKRMLAAVPKATVVVTNPTHYAVALAYERSRKAAPRVVAKGVDSLAARIREIAEANRVPVLANPPLARALYQVELDTEIAPEHYKAVAEIIAYVWRLATPAARAVPAR